MALREVLAQLDVQVRGLGDVAAAEQRVDEYLATVRRGPTALEALKIKQREAGEVARGLAQAIAKLQKAEGDNSVELMELRVELERTTQRAKEFGEEAARVEAGAKGASTGFGGFVANMRSAIPVAVAAIAATAGVRAAIGSLVELVGGVIDAGDELDKVSQRIGVSSRALQEWRFIADHAGISSEQMDHTLTTLNRTAGQAAIGQGEAADSFRRLGVSLRDSNGATRETTAIFADVRRALSAIANPLDRAAVASRIFGEESALLNPILNQTDEQIAQTTARFAELGGGLSDGVVEDSAAAQDALGDFRLAMSSLRVVLVANVLPAVTAIVTALATFAGAVTAVLDRSNAMKTLLGFLAVAVGALTLAMLPMIATTLAVLAPFALLFLAIEDIVTAFSGGESVFGGFVDWLLEASGSTLTFADLVRMLGETWDRTIASTLSGLADLSEALEGVQMMLGLGDLDAAGARTGDLRTRTRRALMPGPATVESPEEKAAKRSLAARGAGVVQQSIAPVIHIHEARDSHAAGRAVDSVMRRQIREAAETLPVAPEPA